MLHVGTINDPDEEDSDDNAALMFLFWWLIHNKIEAVVHLVLDCGARIDYFFKVLGFLLENDHIVDSKAYVRIYLAEACDEQRTAEVRNRMRKALNVPGNQEFDIRKTNHAFLSIDQFPWDKLHIFFVEAPQYSVPMNFIDKMPPTSPVIFVGDSGSVNSRGFDHDELKHACTRNCVSGQSRYIGLPPVDKDGLSGMTRQGLTSFELVSLFLVLGRGGGGVVFQNLAMSFCESLRRTIFDRPNNERNGTITGHNIDSYLVVKGKNVFIDGKKVVVKWGGVEPKDVEGNIIEVNEHTGKVKVHVQPVAAGRMPSTMDVEVTIERPEGNNLRGRINRSNATTVRKFIYQLVTACKTDPTMPLETVNVALGEQQSSWSLADLDNLTSHVLQSTMKGHQVLVGRKGEKAVDISDRLRRYVAKYMGVDVTGDQGRESEEEFHAILFCTLASVFIFGNVLSSTEPIAMADDMHEAVLDVISGGFGGRLKKGTPNYDTVGMYVGLQTLKGCLDVKMDKCELGHCVVGHQNEAAILEYEKCDQECIRDIGVLASKYVECHRSSTNI